LGTVFSAEVDPIRWPHTSAVLHFHEMEVLAKSSRQPTLAFAYRAIIEKAERELMTRVA
jgi:hypothetical protein